MRWHAVVVIAGCLVASAHADPVAPLELAARTHGSALELEFRNRGSTPVALPINTAGYDDRLSITLTRPGAPRLDYRFREPRDRRVARSTTIAPHATYTETFDLVSSALRGNVDPPPPGNYQVSAVWTHPGGSPLTATTELAIAAPVEQPCKSRPVASGIELLARQVAAAGTVEIGLHNTSSASICVAARVDAAFPQSDWLTVELEDTHGKPLRTLRFVAVRHASVRVTVELAPGATTWGRWDLAEWARRSSSAPLHGLMRATITYHGERETDVFHGKLVASLAVNMR